MKYMLLVYGDEQASDEAEKEQCYRESARMAHQIRSTGQCLAAAPLHPVASATSVRVREGKRLVTDGPFAETREQLGGYFIVDVKDLDEAIDIAGRLPGARFSKNALKPSCASGASAFSTIAFCATSYASGRSSAICS